MSKIVKFRTFKIVKPIVIYSVTLKETIAKLEDMEREKMKITKWHTVTAEFSKG